MERAGIREEAESEISGVGVIEKGVGRGKHTHTFLLNKVQK